MSSRVLSTMATSSVSSAGGTWNFASVMYRWSSMKADGAPRPRPDSCSTGYREVMDPAQCTYYGRAVRDGGYVILQYWYWRITLAAPLAATALILLTINLRDLLRR
jgi:hypothetical protein